MQSTNRLAQTMDTDVILILDNDDKKITFTGKARGVQTDVEYDYEDIQSDYYSAFPRHYLKGLDSKTIIEWQYDEGKAYTMKVEDKEKKKKMPKKKTEKITVTTLESGEFTFEARDGYTLEWSIHEDGYISVYEVDIWAGRKRIGAVAKGWTGVLHERADD